MRENAVREGAMGERALRVRPKVRGAKPIRDHDGLREWLSIERKNKKASYIVGKEGVGRKRRWGGRGGEEGEAERSASAEDKRKGGKKVVVVRQCCRGRNHCQCLAILTVHDQINTFSLWR